MLEVATGEGVRGKPVRERARRGLRMSAVNSGSNEALYLRGAGSAEVARSGYTESAK